MAQCGRPAAGAEVAFWQPKELITDESRNYDKNRWIALYVLCAGMLMIVLDVTVVNVALPSIQDDLGFSQRASPGS